MPNILFVDHDIKRLAELRFLLGEEFEVEPAFNGWDGLGAVLMYKPKLVLFNLSSKIMTGVEALRLLRSEENSANLPVLGFTTPINEIVEKVSMEAGCTAIMNYPFEPELKNIILDYLAVKDPVIS